MAAAERIAGPQLPRARLYSCQHESIACGTRGTASWIAVEVSRTHQSYASRCLLCAVLRLTATVYAGRSLPFCAGRTRFGVHSRCNCRDNTAASLCVVLLDDETGCRGSGPVEYILEHVGQTQCFATRIGHSSWPVASSATFDHRQQQHRRWAAHGSSLAAGLQAGLHPSRRLLRGGDEKDVSLLRRLHDDRQARRRQSVAGARAAACPLSAQNHVRDCVTGVCGRQRRHSHSRDEGAATGSQSRVSQNPPCGAHRSRNQACHPVGRRRCGRESICQQQQQWTNLRQLQRCPQRSTCVVRMMPRKLLTATGNSALCLQPSQSQPAKDQCCA